MAKFSKIITESNEKRLINKFIEIFKIKLNKKNKKSKRLTFVLTGGKSPIKLYKALSKTKKIEWENVDFFIGDERYIKENSKYSNINLCKKYFLNKSKISSKQIFKISINNKSIKKDTLNYENKIKKYFLNKKVIFDIVLLGIGNDGHIASLFKKNIAKKNKKIVDHVNKRDFQRITLTIRCINNSNNIFLWAPGKIKSNIIKKIIADKTLSFPASYLRKKNNYLFNCN
jgi:6-phosphogluconolactonase